MKRIALSLMALVVLAAGSGALGWWAYRGSSEASVPAGDVALVNGEPITRGRWAAEVALNERARAVNGSAAPADLNELIDKTLREQAAAQAGLACTEAEARSDRDEERSLFTHDVGEDAVFAYSVLLPKVVIDGDVPEDYLLTPEAIRTPSAADAVAKYWASPTVLAAFKEACVLEKVRRMFEDKQPRGAWIKSLREHAHILIAPDARPTPTAIPTPLPPPRLGCGSDFPCPH